MSSVVISRRPAPRHPFRGVALLVALLLAVAVAIALPTAGSFFTGAAHADCTAASATRLQVMSSTAEGDRASAEVACAPQRAR